MPNQRLLLCLGALACLLACGSAVSSAQTNQPQAAHDEDRVWNLEHEYWGYVQDNNLAAYLDLWHKDFLGWPLVSSAPIGKDHITDWITSQTTMGLAFRLIEFKPAKLQMSADLAVACYWVTYKWLDKDGKGDARTVRITHTWVRDAKDWRIIGGMSMPEPATAKK